MTKPEKMYIIRFMIDDGLKIKKHLKFEEVMDILNVSRPTLHKLIIETQLPAIKIGSEWRIDPDDLATYLSNKKKEIYLQLSA